MFLGTTFLGAKYTALPTAAYSKDENYIRFGFGLYSDVYGSKSVSFPITDDIPESWDWNTIIKANYSTGELKAGNTEWTLQTVSELAIKKRIKGTFKWITIEVRDINVTEDFNFSGVDKYSKSNTTYEYAIVPYLNRNPGNYTIVEVESMFDATFVLEKDISYKTFITNAFCDTVRNFTGNYNTPLVAQYPVFFHSGLMNYDSGSVDGQFYELDDNCRLQKDYGYLFKNKLKDFLSNGRPKILKHPDGRIWLIQVVPNINDSADGRYDLRNIHFDWIEVGSVDNVEDLYNADLIDLSQEWWD